MSMLSQVPFYDHIFELVQRPELVIVSAHKSALDHKGTREMKKAQAKKGEKLFVGLAIMLVLVLLTGVSEVVLRVMGTFETYGEKNGFGYKSLYNERGVIWFNRRSPGPHEIVKPEYTELLYANEHGFADGDWPLAKEPDEIRVLTLGGSFVEGAGSLHQSSNYPSRLNDLLENQFGNHAKILVMNGGMGGSDPIYNLQSLRRVFFDYQPDLIVQSVDAGDWMVDIPVRGGLDRFNEDGTVDARGPWFEPIYKHSHFFRAFIREVLNFRSTLMSKSEHNRRADQAILEICKVFKQENAIAQELSADLVITAIEDKSDLIGKEEPSDRLLSLMECAGKQASVAIDLGEKFLQRFSPKEIEKLYWPIDEHFKPDGYEAYAKIVAAAIEPLVASRIENLKPAARSESPVPMTRKTENPAR